MKTKMKKLMLIMMVIVFASANALAFEDSLMINESKSFKLTISEVSNPTQITLLDKRNNILYKQSIEKGENFSKTFNLELLQSGEYTVEIETETKVKVVALELNDDEVLSNASKSSEYYKPILSAKSGIVYVSQFSPDQTPLYIAVYNTDNELIHEETLGGRMDLGKMFNFSKAYSGHYRFYMEANGVGYDELVYIEK